VTLFIIAVLVSALMLTVAFGLRSARLHRQGQARAFHPSRRTQPAPEPFPHSGWYVVVAVLLVVLLLLYVAGR
jgi:hypothetical protein